MQSCLPQSDFSLPATILSNACKKNVWFPGQTKAPLVLGRVSFSFPFGCELLLRIITCFGYVLKAMKCGRSSHLQHCHAKVLSPEGLSLNPPTFGSFSQHSSLSSWNIPPSKLCVHWHKSMTGNSTIKLSFLKAGSSSLLFTWVHRDLAQCLVDKSCP